MESELGRFFEGWPLDIMKLMKALHDIATGAGKGVQVWIDGRELVFSKTEPKSDRGFLRLIPSDTNVIVAFPNGDKIYDPRARLKGPPRSQKSMILGGPWMIDIDIRRLIEAAYNA